MAPFLKQSICFNQMGYLSHMHSGDGDVDDDDNGAMTLWGKNLHSTYCSVVQPPWRDLRQFHVLAWRDIKVHSSVW